MNVKQKLENLIEKGMTQEEAFLFFDELETVNLEALIGYKWKGKEAPSNHPLDGGLSLSHWYGKEFISPEEVHPLIFERANGELFNVDPAIVFGIRERTEEFLNSAETTESKARLRMTEYRGKISATMIYDQLPVNDIFRKVDENTLFGVMDFKGSMHHLGYFFVLERTQIK